MRYKKRFVTSLLSIATYSTAVVLRILTSSQSARSEGLFKASVFTPVNSFTSDVEGPALNKNGIVYAVNFAKEGTIGQVTPAGESTQFIQLP